MTGSWMSLSQGSDLFSSEHNLKFWEDNLSKELGKLIMCYYLASMGSTISMQLGSMGHCEHPGQFQGQYPKNSSYKVFKA